MILCIDIGNTNIKVAVFAGEAMAEHPLHVWRISSDTRRTADEYMGVLSAFGSVSPAITRAAISSVVPALTPVLTAVVKSLTGCAPLIISADMPLPVTMSESARHQIGADLLCDAVEVYSRTHGPCIVCDAGTALSFVAVSGDGAIAGVAIAPGINTAMASLVGGTAQLYSVPLVLPPSSLGQNTTEALQSGVVLGYTHLVHGLLDQMKSDMVGDGQCTTFVTGGLMVRYTPPTAGHSPTMVRYTPPTAGHSPATGPIDGLFDVVDPDITICGLYRMCNS